MKKILSYLIPAVILIGIFGGIALKLKKNKAISAERVYRDKAGFAVSGSYGGGKRKTMIWVQV